jgi:hypothetical protein
MIFFKIYLGKIHPCKGQVTTAKLSLPSSLHSCERLTLSFFIALIALTGIMKIGCE